MDFLITDAELAALSGLPHLQQLAYLRGIRPYMDVKTGLVGIKRGISYQSIAEQLYIEPHPGIKSVSFTKIQIRRAVASLARVGLITVQSEGLQLILKCNLASKNYSVQNKVITKPTHQVIIGENAKPLINTEPNDGDYQKADIVERAKADTPLINNNYIYLLSQFDLFWLLYPEKKSKQSAWAVFQSLNPDEALCSKILTALNHQIKERTEKEAHGIWAPPWKYPANWLAKRCFEDVVLLNNTKENSHAKNWKPRQPQSSKDMFFCDVEPGDSEINPHTNIIPFKCTTT